MRSDVLPFDFSCRLLRLLVLNKHRVGGAYMFLVVMVANNLHVVETELDFDALVG